jgi:hypothetical protein
VIVCRQRSKTPGDSEVGQDPDFLSITPPSEVSQNQAIPLSKDIKACRHVLKFLVRPVVRVFIVVGQS